MLPAAKRDYVLKNILHKPPVSSKAKAQGTKPPGRSPKSGDAKYRGSKTGKYEQTSGGATKLSSIDAK